MVQINLLPADAAKKHRRKLGLKLGAKPLIYSLGAIILVVIMTWGLLSLRLSGKRRDLDRQKQQLAALKSTLQKLDQLKQEKKTLVKKLEFMDRTLKTEVLWAQNLNRLSKLLPDGIWFKSVAVYTKKRDDLDKYEKLDIKGSAVSVDGREMIDLIGSFMSSIKSDQIFGEQFSQIQLISSQRGKVGKLETMDFSLLCQFR